MSKDKTQPKIREFTSEAMDLKQAIVTIQNQLLFLNKNFKNQTDKIRDLLYSMSYEIILSEKYSK